MAIYQKCLGLPRQAEALLMNSHNKFSWRKKKKILSYVDLCDYVDVLANMTLCLAHMMKEYFWHCDYFLEACNQK